MDNPWILALTLVLATFLLVAFRRPLVELVRGISSGLVIVLALIATLFLTLCC